MTLRIELKPFEKVFIGDAVLTNSDQRTMFIIDGQTPVLRAKDALAPESAKTPAEKLYLCIQNMFLLRDHKSYQGAYLALAAETISGAPLEYPLLSEVDRFVTNAEYYKGLKTLRKLISPDTFTADPAPTPGYRPRAAFEHHR
jgi:flagellar biosynthesis repressor protein FlbT